MQISVSTGPQTEVRDLEEEDTATPSLMVGVGIGHFSAGCHSALLDTSLYCSLPLRMEAPKSWIPLCTAEYLSASLVSTLHHCMPFCTSGCLSALLDAYPVWLPSHQPHLGWQHLQLLLSCLGAACGCPAISYGWESKT
jgi:hypothetical protein